MRKIAERPGFVYSEEDGYVYTTSKETGETRLFGDMSYYRHMLLFKSFSDEIVEINE